MGNSMQGLVDVTVAHEPIWRWLRVLADVFAAFSRGFLMLSRPNLFGSSGSGSGQVRIEVRTKAQRRWSAERLLRKMIKMAFEERGLKSLSETCYDRTG